MNDLYLHQLETENKQLRKRIKLLEEYGEAVGERRNELYDKIDKASEILSKSCFEYDNCPDNVINEIIELKEILGGNNEN